jgi:HlyD family type I secretion membrane fusion protein
MNNKPVAITGPMRAPAAPAAPPVRKTVIWGSAVTLAFVGGFAAWSVFAPLAISAIAPGQVTVESNRQIIQNLEGGIIADFTVAEGDEVKPGDTLLKLDTTQAEAGWKLQRAQLDALEAQEARIVAERDGLDTIYFPPRLVGMRAMDEGVEKILGGEETIFRTRQETVGNQLKILEQRIGQLRTQAGGIKAQERSAAEQLAFIAQEIKDVNFLLEKGLAQKPRLLALQRQGASLEGTVGELRAQLARTEQQIGETELQILNLKNDRAKTLAEELRTAQEKIADLEERLRAAADVLDRREVKAPIGGVVTDMKFFTKGGVIPPGAPILALVPKNDKMLIEARVNPMDIDIVQPGLPAKVRLTALRQRTTPPVDGIVRYVSADVMRDERSGQMWYTARVEVDRAQIDAIPDAKLTPGMPAEVMIVTGERTLANYIFSPLAQSFNRALREQ